MDIGIYQKIGFKDRKDNKPNTYQVDGEAKEILKDNSGLIESGTPLNADNFEHIEEGILQNSRNISSLNNIVEDNNITINTKVSQSAFDSFSSSVESQLKEKANKIIQDDITSTKYELGVKNGVLYYKEVL